MSRRPSKHRRPVRPLSAGHATAAQKADGRWIVRSIPGDRAVKDYTCPGCGHTIKPGIPHVVVWQSEAPSWGVAAGVDARRHWHTSCWERRR